jgi:hypothetical protein
MWTTPLSHRRDLLGQAYAPWPHMSTVRDLLRLPTRNVNPYDLRPDLVGEVTLLLRQGELPSEVAAAVVPRLWLRLAPNPLVAVPATRWRRLWAVSGWTVHGQSEQRPVQPLRIYRGGSPTGWSWTDDPEIALAFASGFGTRAASGLLWTAAAPPEALCARVPAAVNERTGEVTADEVVVDPTTLADVRPWTAEEEQAIRLPRIATLNGRPTMLI